eukprot:13987303-Heterocapsa_arctica.AAC.1
MRSKETRVVDPARLLRPHAPYRHLRRQPCGSRVPPSRICGARVHGRTDMPHGTEAHQLQVDR